MSESRDVDLGCLPLFLFALLVGCAWSMAETLARIAKALEALAK
jgi:hypothetical protein